MTRIASSSDFVTGTAGALFRTCSWPAVTRDGVNVAAGSLLNFPGESLPTILFVAPIGEEMNRSRRFLAALRRECARRGARAVLVDPFGTGDSAGEFVEAVWEIWVDDLVAEAEALAATGEERSLTLLGVRSGCLLVDALVKRLDPPPARLVEIQPEHDGAAVVRRLLSTRALADRLAGGEGRDVAALEELIAAGETLELGGYEISAALLRALGASAIDPAAAPLSTGPSCRFDLTEAVSSTSENRSESYASIAQAGVSSFGVPESSGGTFGPDEQGTRGACWQHFHFPTRPFWRLAESVPDPRVVVRIAERLFQ